MVLTVFATVLSGVLTYVLGQLVLKLVVDPVQEAKRTIGEVSMSLIEHSQAIHNPGVLKDEAMASAANQLRKLSSKLHGHLYLIPKYDRTAKLFQLPAKAALLVAATDLAALSTTVYKATDGIYEQNAKRCERICDALSIYLPEDSRWPRECR